jgi:hypothetical protein
MPQPISRRGDGIWNDDDARIMLCRNSNTYRQRTPCAEYYAVITALHVR